MLLPADLRALSAWCHRHRMTWLPGCSDDGEDGLLLRPRPARPRGADMLLVAGPAELRLLGDGQTVASASALPALLDALDAGLAAGATAAVPPPHRCG